MASLKKGEFKNLALAFAKVIDGAGDLLMELGKAEKNNPELSKLISELRKNPQSLNELLTQVPPEYTTKFFGIIMKISLVSQKYQQFSIMNSEDKINTGKQVKQIATELMELD